MKLKKLLSTLLVSALTLTALSGCSDTEKIGEGDAGIHDSQSKVLKIATGRSFYEGEGSTIYLHGTTNVWESLVKLNNDMTTDVGLAESIEPSEDYLSWTIKLQKGIMFHDGSELNAEVVKYNLDRMYHFDKAEKKYNPESKNVEQYGEIESIEVIDEYSVKVTHAKPVVDFMSRLAYSPGAMFSLKSFNEDGQIVTPYGCGPFKLKEYDDQNDVITLEKYEDYRDGEPNLDEVVFKKIEDPSTRLAALQSGEIDAIADVGAIMPQQADKIKSDANLELMDIHVATEHYMHLNRSEGKLFNNNDLMKALAYAVDTETIVNNLLQGYGVQGKSVITSTSKKYFEDCSYEYNLEKAKELKEKSVGSDEITINILINASLKGRWPYENVAMYIQAQLEQIGIKSNIEIVDPATWTERLKAGDYDMTLAPYTISTGEPSFYFEPYMKSTGPMNKNRSYGINNPEIDALIAKASSELDDAKRVELYKELQRIAKEEGPTIPLWEDVTLYAVNKKVKNFSLDICFWPDLAVVDIEQ